MAYGYFPRVVSEREYGYSGDNSYNQNEIRILLIGKTGTGKSSTGNTILGYPAFHAAESLKSVTSICETGKSKRYGKEILVVDTPGLFDTGKTQEQVIREIAKSMGILAPGPHALILVVSKNRFTPEEQNTVDNFMTFFGEGMINYVIVLMTGMDAIRNTFHEYIKTATPNLKSFLQRCGNRCIGFNNVAEGENTQVQDLLRLIENTVQQNGGSFYTTEMLTKAEKEMEKATAKKAEEKFAKKRQRREEITREVRSEIFQECRDEVRGEVQREETGIFDVLLSVVAATLKLLWKGVKKLGSVFA